MKVKITQPIFQTDPQSDTYKELNGVELEMYAIYNGRALCKTEEGNIWSIPAEYIESQKESP